MNNLNHFRMLMLLLLTLPAVTGNSAYYGGAYRCTLNNCIVYINRLQNSRFPVDGSSFNHCCTTPCATWT